MGTAGSGAGSEGRAGLKAAVQPYRKVRVIRVSWPVAPSTLKSVLAGNAAAVNDDPALAPLLAILRAENCLGDFGLYRAVAEVSPCLELFEAQQGARPTLGEAGQAQASTNLMVTIHADARVSQAVFDRAVAELVAAHPWEVPVIEVSEAAIALRPDQLDR